MSKWQFLILINALAVVSACNRIPLTPPNSGQPQFGFNGTTWEGAFAHDEASGAWTFATDTVAPYIQYATTYSDYSSDEAWQLVYHRAVVANSVLWNPGVLEHRVQGTAGGSGQLSTSGVWSEWGDWTVNGEPVELDEGGALFWEADANGVVELAGELEWEYDGDDMEQRFEVVLEGLGGCDAAVLPGLLGVEVSDSDWQGVTWHFYPPSSDPGMTWHWVINGDEIEITEGPGALHVEMEGEDEADELEVRLVAVAEDNHPYGVFDVLYRASWEDNWDDEMEEWFYADLAPLTLNATEPSDWMELRYRSAAGDWYSSELLCDEADQPNWKFEVLEVLEPAQSSLYPIEERIEFSCALPLRLDGQWENPLNTVEVSGMWPVLPLE